MELLATRLAPVPQPTTFCVVRGELLQIWNPLFLPFLSFSRRGQLLLPTTTTPFRANDADTLPYLLLNSAPLGDLPTTLLRHTIPGRCVGSSPASTEGLHGCLRVALRDQNKLQSKVRIV